MGRRWGGVRAHVRRPRRYPASSRAWRGGVHQIAARGRQMKLLVLEEEEHRGKLDAERRVEPGLQGPGGGRKGSAWVDVTAQKADDVVRVQTVDTTPNN